MQHGLFKINRPVAIAIAEAAQPVAEPPHILLGQAAAAGQKDESKEDGRRRGRQHRGLAGMQRQAPPSEIIGDAHPPFGENFGVVVKESEVIDVSNVGRAQHLRGKMIEAVQIDVGKKLAGQIADR